MADNSCNILLGCWKFLNSQFISSSLGAFFGAVSSVFGAFSLNKWLEEEKIKQNKLNYLQFTISTLSSLLNSLYNFKQQFIVETQTVSEMNYLRKAIKTGREQIEKGEKFHIALEITFKKLFDKILYKCPFLLDIEKLNFLSEINIEINGLLINSLNQIETLNNIIEDFNAHIESGKFQSVGNTDFSNFELLFAYRRELASVNDELINSIELLAKCVAKAGFIIDKKFGKYTLVNDKFQDLKPPTKNERWEDLEKWAEEE
ncbi:MAG: hypothetical protein WCF95_02125 [bacterium]